MPLGQRERKAACATVPHKGLASCRLRYFVPDLLHRPFLSSPFLSLRSFHPRIIPLFDGMSSSRLQTRARRAARHPLRGRFGLSRKFLGQAARLEIYSSVGLTEINENSSILLFPDAKRATPTRSAKSEQSIRELRIKIPPLVGGIADEKDILSSSFAFCNCCARISFYVRGIVFPPHNIRNNFFHGHTCRTRDRTVSQSVSRFRDSSRLPAQLFGLSQQAGRQASFSRYAPMTHRQR